MDFDLPGLCHKRLFGSELRLLSRGRNRVEPRGAGGVEWSASFPHYGKLFEEFSTVWKIFQRFFHSMENFLRFFPRYGKNFGEFSTL